VDNLVEVDHFGTDVACRSVRTEQLFDLGDLVIVGLSALESVNENLLKVGLNMGLGIGLHHEDVEDLVAELLQGDLGV
jgi:hypothetical protein